MELVDRRLIFSASDLINHLECPHLTHLDIEVALGRSDLTETRSDTTELVARKGDEHERDYLVQLRYDGRETVEIESESGLEGTRAGARRTVEAMQAGVEVIYQGVLFDGVHWRGHSDFLHRVECPSALGSFSYEVADTKLARRVKPYFLLQLCFYSELVEAIQGVAPEWMHVVLGTRETQSFRVAEFAAYYRSVKRRLRGRCRTPACQRPTPSRSSTAQLCRWEEHCVARREADDHLSLVARIQRSQRTPTGRARASRPSRSSPPRSRRIAHPGSGPPRSRLYARRRVYTVDQRRSGQSCATSCSRPRQAAGSPACRQPSAGDVFFDMEGDPFFDDGLEYLFGCVSYR